MKKCFLLFSICFSLLSNAQDSSFVKSVNNKTKFGLKGGMNISKLNGDLDYFKLTSRVGFNIGAFVDINLSEKFALQPELLISTQGADADFKKNF